jgi:hypothetical protein
MNLAETHVLAAGVAVSLLDPAAVAASANGAAVAITPPARGHAAVILMVDAASAGTLPTFDFKLQSSDASGSGFADIPGAAAPQTTTVKGVYMIPFLPGAVGKYIRGVSTVGGSASPSFTASAVLVYFGA